MQFRRQRFVIPPGIQGQLIVSQDVGAALGFGQMVENHHRHRV